MYGGRYIYFLLTAYLIFYTIANFILCLRNQITGPYISDEKWNLEKKFIKVLIFS